MGKLGCLFHICSPQLLPWPTAATQQGWGWVGNPQPAIPWACGNTPPKVPLAQTNEAQLCPPCSARGSEIVFYWCEMKPKQRRCRAPESRAQPSINSLRMTQNRNIPIFRWENLKAKQAHKGQSTGESLRRSEQPQHCCAAAHAGPDSSQAASWGSHHSINILL